MSYSTDPAAATAATLPPCPSWCDPRYCEVAEGEVLHRGAPVRVETDGATYDLSLERADENDFPKDWGGTPWVDLTTTSRVEAAGPDGLEPKRLSVLVNAADLPALIDALTAVHLLVRLAGGVS
ncbi:MAG: hypothetical protein LC799_34960 [Actinobacteria bacterium]|nr:hypothetical protein [Actinomycetota bacterium]